jgi:ABC-type oligopeptide transport system substrate-binding subunit
MAYSILYGQAYNEGASFVRDIASGQLVPSPDDPARHLVVNSDTKPKPGQQLVPVRAEDIGVEGLDDRTLRIRTSDPVPYLPGLVAHQFFSPVPRKPIEQFGEEWTRPEHIISSGPFTLQTWKPYDQLVVVRNPTYWDAARVRLDRITFYPLEASTTMMNLYKAGDADAVYNHVPPAAWLDQLRPLKDYMDKPENGSEFYYINTTRPPTNDVRVRKALSMSIDRVALAEFRRTAKPLTGLVPTGVFPGYPNPEGDPFDPVKAKKLLADAGYRDASGAFDPSRFPSSDIEISYNTNDSNRQVAEFVQAQWKQNLGLTIGLRNMEFRTFLGVRAKRDYRGVARSGWSGDYMDPFTFLDLFSTRDGNNGSGWFDPVYARMLRDANRERDPQTRYDLLAKAERLVLDAQPFIPLFTPATNWMKKPYVMGMYANPLTLHVWKYVWIEHDPAKWN